VTLRSHAAVVAAAEEADAEGVAAEPAWAAAAEEARE
jgi:hypothetical protein